MIIRLRMLIAAWLAVSIVACSGRSEDATVTADVPPAAGAMASDPTTGSPAASTVSELAGTKWELLRIQSMDDTEWVPADPSRYTLSIEPDGSAYMKFDCNQGNARWTSEGPAQISFAPVASTNALCQDDGLGERYARQFEYVRSYVIRDDHLFLATMADGAIIEFRPVD